MRRKALNVMTHLEDDTKVSGTMVAIILLLALVPSAPAIYMMSTPIGPAAWLIGMQARAIDGHYPVATFVVLMGMELAVLRRESCSGTELPNDSGPLGCGRPRLCAEPFRPKLLAVHIRGSQRFRDTSL